MKTTSSLGFIAMLLLLSGITLTTGCSGSREDVRVTLCKELTSALMDSFQTLIWQGNENTFHYPEYVAVKVMFEIPDDSVGEAVCFYNYDTVDENAMTHSRPLSAYSTLPDKMRLNGEPVDSSVLTDAIHFQQLNIFIRLMNKLKFWSDKTSEKPGELSTYDRD